MNPSAWAWPRALAEAKGWKRRGLLILFGLAAAGALPPLHLVALLVPAFAGLVLMLDRPLCRAGAFFTGWWWGFGYFTAGLYWIANALFVDIAKFGWLVPFAVFGLSAGFAIFPGLATLLVRDAKSQGPARLLVLAGAWTLVEWLRGWVLTGFPWNLIGTVWTFSDVMIQPASAIGAHGLGFITVFLAALPVLLVERQPGPRVRLALAGGLALAILWVGFGWARLAGASDAMVPGVRLRLVQANIDQKEKWRQERRADHVAKHLDLSRRPPDPPSDPPPTHILWPETAVPFLVERDPMALSVLAQAVPPGGLLITGVPRASAPAVEPFEVWNSLVAIDGQGRVVGAYDKVHLVPFGEYVPLRGLLPIERIVPSKADFSTGPGPVSLALPGLPPASPLICYEVIFPGAVTDPANRPAWLLNVTNDGWFGMSSGPYQHLAAAILRAVEEGLPLVRAANTGISVVVNPYGRTVSHLKLGQTGFLDSPLPKPTPLPTYYSRFRDTPFLFIALVSVLLFRRFRGY
ncbi:MAG: apolipoprotein N-acyltransferase [Rhodospirillales bacterium]|nr:apolipoprotein N-acyltransferase [Rhodospirillales bacterium]